MRTRRFVTLVVGALALVSCGGSSSSPAAGGPSTTPQSLKLPVVDIAGTAACQADMQLLEAAENVYVTLHGELASLDELVQQQILRAAPVYYREVRIGTPAGGYTLIGVPGKCGNVPVAGG
jgi:hypothetical protein